MWKGAAVERFIENCLPLGNPPARVGKSSSRKKEQQKQDVMNWPQPPFHIQLHHCRGGGGECGSEVNPRKKGGVQEGVFMIWVYFL